MALPQKCSKSDSLQEDRHKEAQKAQKSTEILLCFLCFFVAEDF
jgi:hypothetical protein